MVKTRPRRWHRRRDGMLQTPYNMLHCLSAQCWNGLVCNNMPFGKNILICG